MVLAVLESGRAHGYGIAAELRRRSDGALEVLEGSLYPALHRLEAEGWVESNWEKSDGRRRRSYELTADGKTALVERRRLWADFRTVMDDLLEDARG
jgi:DNA-binding PadR family transcriptional regulator